MMDNSVKRFSARGIFVVFLCLAVSACGSGAVGSSSSSSGYSSSDSSGFTSAPVGGNVSQLSISDGTSSSVDLSGLAGEEEAVLLIYSYSTSSSAQAFQISASQNALNLINNDDALWMLSDEEGFVANDADLTGEFHDLLRENEAGLDDSAMLTEPESATKARFATIGGTRTFKVLNSFSNTSSYETVTAELRVTNDETEFYVDVRDADLLTDTELQTLLDGFAVVVDDEQRIAGSWSDVNGDGKFAVLFTRVVNELGSSAGGVVTGFFYAIDLFGSSSYDASNEMEVYYTFVPDPDGEHGVAVTSEFAFSNIYPGVLPHEFQHMISFNQHYFTYGGSAESGWLNEGLSHLMEDIHSLDADDFMTASGLENPARVASYLSDVANICFTCGTSLSQRGGAYLFLRYLYEQAQLGNLPGVENGTEMIRNLVQTNDRSLSNLKNVLFDSTDADDELMGLIGQFTLAVYLSNTGLSEDSSYNFTGLDLRAIQDDNRGTVLNGPFITGAESFPYLETLSGNSMTFIRIDADNAAELGGSLNLSFGEGSSFGGYLIRE